MVQHLIRMPGCNHVEAYSYTIEELCIPFGGCGWREESQQEGFLFILLIPASLDYRGFTTTWAWISNRMSIIKDWSCMFTVTSSHKILAVFTQRSCNTAAKRPMITLALLFYNGPNSIIPYEWVISESMPAFQKQKRPDNRVRNSVFPFVTAHTVKMDFDLSLALFTQPVQDGTVATLFCLANLYKTYKGWMWGWIDCCIKGVSWRDNTMGKGFDVLLMCYCKTTNMEI